MKDFWCVYFRECIIVSNYETCENKIKTNRGWNRIWTRSRKQAESIFGRVTKESSLPILLFWLKYRVRLTWAYHEQNMPETLLDHFEEKEAHFVPWRKGSLHSAFRLQGHWTPSFELLKRHFMIRRRNDSGWKWQL